MARGFRRVYVHIQTEVFTLIFSKVRDPVATRIPLQDQRRQQTGCRATLGSTTAAPVTARFKARKRILNIIKQCQQWHQENQFQNIVDALEAYPESERTQAMDMELARAYNNLGVAQSRKALLKKAIALLQKHAHTLANDALWNFRLGYAYYYQDQEGRALPYFQKALELDPSDEDAQTFIRECESRLAMPFFQQCFRLRVEKAWQYFLAHETALYANLQTKSATLTPSDDAPTIHTWLHIAFDHIAFEVRFEGGQPTLILTPEGAKVKLFEIEYFYRQAPAIARERWRIEIGRPATSNLLLQIHDQTVATHDIEVWVRQKNERSVELAIYSEKVLALFAQHEEQVWWMLSTFLDHALGEIAHMRFIEGIEILREHPKEPSVNLTQLRSDLIARDIDLAATAATYLNIALPYRLTPQPHATNVWRLDITQGVSQCAPLINGYLENNNDPIDELHANGAVAGFIALPLEHLPNPDEELMDWVHGVHQIDARVLTVTGHAKGLTHGYIDFIAWDFQEALERLQSLFKLSDFERVLFHSFRRQCQGVVLVSNPPVTWQADNPDAFYEQIDKWNDADEFSRCIRALKSLPAKARDDRATIALARALENFAILGDHNQGTAPEVGEQAIRLALQVLEGMRESGQKQAAWHMRMAYAYEYLAEYEVALTHAQQWQALAPTDANAPRLIQVCQTELIKRMSTPPSSTSDWLEQLDLEHFWEDEHPQAQTYRSADFDDAQLKQIEEVLEVKLPESYVALMRTHNGGIPHRRVLTLPPSDFNLPEQMQIQGIWGIGQKLPYAIASTPSLILHNSLASTLKPCVVIANCVELAHFVIALDYRIHGPQKAPAVTLVNSQNPTEVLTLADNFESFIDALKAPNAQQTTTPKVGIPSVHQAASLGNAKGIFAGFILLNQAQWNKADLIAELRRQWQIEVVEKLDDLPANYQNDLLVFNEGAMMATVSLLPYRVPNAEAEANAQNNYMWPDGIDVAQKHCAHLMVAVLGDADEFEKGKLFTKIVAACCRQPHATGVYCNGTVYEPTYYANFAQMMKQDMLPIFNWVWIGLYQDKDGLSAYTYGLTTFGKEELEVLNTPATPLELHQFLMTLVSFILEHNLTVEDDQTLDITTTQKHHITRSPSEIFPLGQMTLKVDWQAFQGALHDAHNDHLALELDDAATHLAKIQEKHLPIHTLQAYSHMAIYLRWCIANDLMDDAFMKGKMAQQIKNTPEAVDIRAFIRDMLDGKLFGSLFNPKGRAFAAYYYGAQPSPNYPSDIDDFALTYFGHARYHSDEFSDEAYLFIPYDDTYYQCIARLIDLRYQNWLQQNYDENTLKPSKVALALNRYLNCECTYLPAMRDDDPVTSAYGYALRLGVREHFVPVLIEVSDGVWSDFIKNSFATQAQEQPYAFDSQRVLQYREKRLNDTLIDAQAYLNALIERSVPPACQLLQVDSADFVTKLPNQNTMKCHWDPQTKKTRPMLLARIPVTKPWEIFAYAPLGGWGPIPDPHILMALTQYWFEKYGAVVVGIYARGLELRVAKPVASQDALTLAKELWALCPSILDNSHLTSLSDLSLYLQKALYWRLEWPQSNT